MDQHIFFAVLVYYLAGGARIVEFMSIFTMVFIATFYVMETSLKRWIRKNVEWTPKSLTLPLWMYLVMLLASWPIAWLTTYVGEKLLYEILARGILG